MQTISPYSKGLLVGSSLSPASATATFGVSSTPPPQPHLPLSSDASLPRSPDCYACSARTASSRKSRKQHATVSLITARPSPQPSLPLETPTSRNYSRTPRKNRRATRSFSDVVVQDARLRLKPAGIQRSLGSLRSFTVLRQSRFALLGSGGSG